MSLDEIESASSRATEPGVTRIVPDTTLSSVVVVADRGEKLTARSASEGTLFTLPEVMHPSLALRAGKGFEVASKWGWVMSRLFQVPQDCRRGFVAVAEGAEFVAVQDPVDVDFCRDRVGERRP